MLPGCVPEMAHFAAAWASAAADAGAQGGDGSRAAAGLLAAAKAATAALPEVSRARGAYYAKVPLLCGAGPEPVRSLCV